MTIDPARNAAGTGDADISAASARVRTLVITAREDVEIARQTRAALGRPARTYHVGTYTVYVWNKNLLVQVSQAAR